MIIRLMDPETHFEREIREQPAILARLLHDGRAAVLALAERIRRAPPAWVTVAARGTSDNAARYAQYVLGFKNRFSVALAAPSLYTLYAAPPMLEGSLVVGISQSGQSPDVVSVVAEGRRQGMVTVAITNDPSSPLATTAEHTLALHAGPETAVAATKTYSAQLLTVAMLAAAIADDAAAWDELEAIPAAVAQTISHAADAAVEAARRYRAAERFAVLGRGFNYATAFEIALKLKETSYVVAEPYSFADFHHGPAALLEPGFPVMLVVTKVHEDLAALLDLLEERGADVTAISDDAAVAARARVSIDLPATVPEWLSPLVAIVPGQLFALNLALARGTNPDRPRGLSKVTETR
jgi:glucosamine--fructose-6-phosphate aminotransferase (isomerizing)